MNRIVLMVLQNFWRVPKAYAKLCHYAKHTDQYPEEEKYAHIQYILDLAVHSGNLEFQVMGLENVPKEGGFMMYGNHQGLFDIVALAATCPRPFGAVLKKELKDIPFLKQLIACTKSFPMDRDDLKQSMKVMVDVTKEVKEGRNYVIFPEGTRSKQGNKMLPFHGGSFRCALKAKCPIVPLTFIDCYKVFDEKGSKPLKAQLHYLEPIPFEEYGHLKSVEVADLVQKRIEDKIAECTK